MTLTPEQASEPQKGNIEKQVDKLNDLMHLVVVVLIVMVATLIVTVGGIVISSYQNQSASYENLTREVQALQNTSTSTIHLIETR